MLARTSDTQTVASHVEKMFPWKKRRNRSSRTQRWSSACTVSLRNIGPTITST